MSQVALEVDRLGPVSLLKYVSDVLTVEAGKPAPPGTRIKISDKNSGNELVQGKIISLEGQNPEEKVWEIQIKLFSPSRKVKSLFNEILRI